MKEQKFKVTEYKKNKTTGKMMWMIQKLSKIGYTVCAGPFTCKETTDEGCRKLNEWKLERV